VVPFEFFRKVEKKLGEWRSACDAWPKIVNVSLRNTAAPKLALVIVVI
jgi:hypothetical protein